MVIINLQSIKDEDLNGTMREGIIFLGGKLWVNLFFFLIEVQVTYNIAWAAGVQHGDPTHAWMNLVLISHKHVIKIMVMYFNSEISMFSNNVLSHLRIRENIKPLQSLLKAYFRIWGRLASARIVVFKKKASEEGPHAKLFQWRVALEQITDTLPSGREFQVCLHAAAAPCFPRRGRSSAEDWTGKRSRPGFSQDGCSAGSRYYCYSTTPNFFSPFKYVTLFPG